jgi:RimJ/RimL family protein N-acetyltransferase
VSAPMAAVDWAPIALTPIEAGDLDKLHAWQNDPQIRDLIMGFRGPIRLEATADWIRNVSEHNLKTRAVFAVRQDGVLKGVAQLHTLDWIHRTALLGIYIGDAGERGAGLGRAATCLLLDYAFHGLDLHRVGLEVVASNVGARRLYEQLGFALEGLQRQAYLRAGAREDIALYGLLKPEWSFIPPDTAQRLVGADGG